MGPWELLKQNLNGNLTALFSLLFDNLVNISVFQSTLLQSFASDNSTVLQNTISKNVFFGSLSGTVVSNLFVYFLTRQGKTGFSTSIPIGVDVPSLFFIASTLFSLYTSKIDSGLSQIDAFSESWADCATINLIMGLTKLVLTAIFYFWDFPSKIDLKVFSGCLAGIGLSLLGCSSLILSENFKMLF